MVVTIFCAKALIVGFIALILIWFVGQTYSKTKSSIHEAQVSDFPTLLEILLAMIDIELQLYENEIFNDREGITNSNFNNFYQDICESIETHISPEFMSMMTVYVTEEFVYTLIARKVKAYLVTKVS